MSRIRAQEAPRGRNRSISYRTEFNQEIDLRIGQLRERIAEVRDLTVDGFPYKDSERVRLELQIRQSIRQGFGDGSPEYQKYQYFRLKPDDLNSTVGLLEELIRRLEKQKFELPDDLRPTNPIAGDTDREAAEERADAISPAEWKSTTPGRHTPRIQSSRTMVEDSASRTVAPSTPTTAARPESTEQIAPGGRPALVRSSGDSAPPSQTGTVQAHPSIEVGTTPRVEATHSKGPNQQSPPSNGRATSKRGESSMIANKLRHDGTETLRDTRAETWEGESGSALVAIRKLCTGFHAVARQLRQRHDDRPTLDVEDEHDVQDLFHALLRLEFQDIRTERWVPSYAGGDERTTFLVGHEGIALVIKRTKPGLGGRELKVQLDIDAQRYSGRPDCQTLLCFVYDPEGRIANPREFEAGLTREDEGGSIAVQISP